jgi:hypothetical protein
VGCLQISPLQDKLCSILWINKANNRKKKPVLKCGFAVVYIRRYDTQQILKRNFCAGTAR